MKYKDFITLGVLLLASSGCRKEQPSPADKLYGDWQWVRSIGGFTGKGVIKPKAGEVVIERFTRDGYWTLCGSGKCFDLMPYTLQKERSVIYNEERLILTLHRKVYLAPPDTGYHVLLDRYYIGEIGDTLRIGNDGPDGYGETYFRK